MKINGVVVRYALMRQRLARDTARTRELDKRIADCMMIENREPVESAEAAASFTGASEANASASASSSGADIYAQELDGFFAFAGSTCRRFSSGISS